MRKAALDFLKRFSESASRKVVWGQVESFSDNSKATSPDMTNSNTKRLIPSHTAKSSWAQTVTNNRNIVDECQSLRSK